MRGSLVVLLLLGCNDQGARSGGAPDVGAADIGAVDVPRPVAEAGHDGRVTDIGEPDLRSSDAAAVDSRVEPDAAPPVPDAAEADLGSVDPNLPEGEDFPLGVASGDVTAISAILWTRYAGAAGLEVALWETVPDGERVHDVARVEPAEGGFVHYESGGLTPGAWYRFAFFVVEGGRRTARSDFGRFRAAIADDALEAVSFGAVSCARNGGRFPTLLRAGHHEDLDLFLLVGDTVYADGARDRGGYRAKWAENLETPAFRRLLASVSVVATWDDHEVDNNWDPETIDPARAAAARGALFEHLPIRRDPMAPERVWRSFRWGRTVEFFVLDSRGERRPSTRGGAEAQYISPAQMDWLQAGLRGSDAVFKVIVNSVPMGDYPTFGVDADRWSGYSAQREALLVFLDLEAIPGVFVVSGDFHLASMGRLTAAGPGSVVPELLVGPAEHLPNPLALLFPSAPNIDWALANNNYATFTLDPVTGEVDVVYYGSAGEVLVERTWLP